MFAKLWFPDVRPDPVLPGELTIAQVIGSSDNMYGLEPSPFVTGTTNIAIHPGVDGTWDFAATLGGEVFATVGVQAEFVSDMPQPGALQAEVYRLRMLRLLRDRYLPLFHPVAIKGWAKTLGDGPAGWAPVAAEEMFGDGDSWLLRYAQAVGLSIELFSHDNLCIYGAEDEDPEDFVELFGTARISPPLGYLPLTKIASWMPEALEWMVSGGEPRAVTGNEVLDWIEGRERNVAS